jgi:predicted RNase H-like HicB family nuclease
MTRTYSLVTEGDESGYSAHVPELPAILVTGKSIEELTSRASEAIQLWWESAISGVIADSVPH